MECVADVVVPMSSNGQTQGFDRCCVIICRPSVNLQQKFMLRSRLLKY